MTQAPTPEPSEEPQAKVPRKRLMPGERRVQILQMLATMLEQPALERITTATLAARLEVSEAALYRHFASKAQMYDGLIEFIEQSVFSLINQILAREADGGEAATLGQQQCARIGAVLVQFAQSNPGMARVMVGDALVFENERLQQRMNLLFDKLEATFRQCLRATGGADGPIRAATLSAFLVGRLQRYVRSGFRYPVAENLDASFELILG